MRKSTDQLRGLLIRHEGCKLDMYLDTMGIPTIGVGRNLKRKPHAISFGEAMLMLDNDIEVCEHEVADAWPWLVSRDDAVRHDVLVNMCFNMGITRLKKFVKFLGAYEAGDYDVASEEMLDSRWAKQVGRRANELARMMRTGVYDVG